MPQTPQRVFLFLILHKNEKGCVIMKKARLLLLTFLLVGTSIISAAAQAQVPSQISDTARHYPVTLTPNWTEMKRTDRVDACQLSNDAIENMSTEELLQTVLAYPFMIDLYAFDTYRAGFEHVYREFPALATLTKRADFGAVLIDFYRNIPVENAYSVSANANYQNIRSLSIIEILIAQEEVTGGLDEAEVNLLIQISEEKNLERKRNLEVNCGNLTTFHNALQENPDSTIARAVATVTTPKGTKVEVENQSSIVDWSAAEKSSLNSQCLAAYPTATKVRDATKKYNCHSYAWYSTSASNYYWMSDPSPYTTDGSYQKTSSSSNGNKVYWQEEIYGTFYPEHSGILADNLKNNPYISCNSKWGQLGLYNHPLDDCPYSSTWSYWTR